MQCSFCPISHLPCFIDCGFCLQPSMIALFEKHRNSKGDQAKLKNPLQLTEVSGCDIWGLQVIEESGWGMGGVTDMGEQS